MKYNFDEITNLIREIENENTKDNEIREKSKTIYQEKTNKRKLLCDQELEEITADFKRRVDLFDQLCEEYLYSDYRDSKIIIEKMRAIFRS